MKTGPAADGRPLVAHVVYRFAVGGLENGVVNLINHMPQHEWRHAVVSLTDVDPAFASRIRREGVPLVALHKPPGQGLWQLWRWRRALRDLRPDIVHTRNLAALEAQLPAFLAGVKGRVHGEHGRDVEDPHGTSRKHRLMRRVYLPLVHQVIALGQELTRYAREQVGVAPSRLHTIYNGVDTQHFVPGTTARALVGFPFNDPSLFVVGTVGRMQTVKAQPVLARAFVQALRAQPELAERLRLVMVGGGPLQPECEAILRDAGAAHLAWLPGERADVPDVMRALNCFVLPSLAEGISNTILEAMACGLPVVATAVGANTELVEDGHTGLVVPAGDVGALAQAMLELAQSPARAADMGRAGRQRVEQRFSLGSMVAAYAGVYRQVLGQRAME